VAWSDIQVWIAIESPPVYYDYGTTIVYTNDTVYSDDRAVATADQYYRQAIALAGAGGDAESQGSEWKPLGIFAMVPGDQKDANTLFQLGSV
jgi:hypothetical protein